MCNKAARKFMLNSLLVGLWIRSTAYWSIAEGAARTVSKRVLYAVTQTQLLHLLLLFTIIAHELFLSVQTACGTCQTTSASTSWRRCSSAFPTRTSKWRIIAAASSAWHCWTTTLTSWNPVVGCIRSQVGLHILFVHKAQKSLAYSLSSYTHAYIHTYN